MDKLQIKDFTRYKFLSNIAVSPNRENVAFVVSTADEKGNTYKGDIWIYNLKSKLYQRLTSTKAGKSFIWLDNDNLIFEDVMDKEYKEKMLNGEDWTIYYKINIHGGEALKYFKVPIKVNSIKKISKNEFIINGVFDHNKLDISKLCGEEKIKAFEKSKEEKDYEIIDEIPFWSDGRGFINKKRDRLYFFNLGKNEMKPISGEFSNVEFYNYSDSIILFTASTYTDKKRTTTGLYRYDIKKEITTELVREDSFNIVYAGYVDNKIVFAGSDMKKFGINENPDFYVIKDGRLEIICCYDNSFGNKISMDCKYGQGITYKAYKDNLYFLSTVNTSTHIKKFNIDGSIETVIGDGGSIECFDICDEGIFFIGLRNGKLQELYLFKDGKEAQLTQLNEEIYKNRKISSIEKITFENDGLEMEGSVIKPSDFDNNKKYPGVLFIHGGPKSTYGEVYHHNMHCIANEGYFVFYTNPRGSDGRGNDYANVVGKQGSIDYDDIMKFTDVVLKKYPNIDANKLGVTGGSYGGFMTNWIIGHTDRFKCAVSESGVANWISKITTTDIGYHFNAIQLGATPWADAEKLWNHSPMKYADNIKTPTLFIQPDEDYRCWLAEGIQMFLSLKYHGVDSKLCIIKGESHDLDITGRPKQRIKRLEEMIEWFNKYLK